MGDEVQQIKDKIDVAELVGEYVQLKQAGINKKGCCPFHNEKTPSFMVNSERQSWHCFGCGKGGDIFTFVEEIEGMEFKEALKYLANRAGVQLTTYRSEVDSSQKNRIKEINKETARFFYNFLIKMPASKSALDYLKNRGIKDETIEEWRIGFVPDQWDLLTQYLLKKGFSIDDLVASGLTIKRDPSASSGRSGQADNFKMHGFYDRFRGRIMFPIWDVHGDVVGFTGRVLVETEKSGGKYVNTPQTIVYDKSKVIYGLNKAKKEIKSQDLIVMVEGQMDVIACSQAGMKNVVASSGTALTEMQIKLLKRYSLNLNMAFDADDAGQNAAKRGIDIALAEGMRVKVIRIPEGAGKDPDECLKKNSEVWFDSVKNAQDVMEWFFDKNILNKDLSDHRQKQKIADVILPEIALIPYAVERDHWLRELSSRISVDVGVLREDIERVKHPARGGSASGGKNAQLDGLKKQKHESTKTDNGQETTSVQKGRYELLLERLYCLVLKFNILVPDFFADDKEKMLSTGEFKQLYEIIKKEYNYDEDGKIDIDKIRQVFELHDKENLVDVLLLKADWEFSGMLDDGARKDFKKLILEIENEWKKKRRREIQVEIEVAEKEKNEERLGELMKEFSKL
ncbi:DNA primase [Patescibacteria group bacterium]|nr:DNA primase [Patescibacteria group bacterium]